MITPEVYEEFRRDVLDVINNKELFTEPKIKVLVKQMGIGKSYFQGKELSPELYKVFFNQKFNIRVAPKTKHVTMVSLKKKPLWMVKNIGTGTSPTLKIL